MKRVATIAAAVMLAGCGQVDASDQPARGDSERFVIRGDQTLIASVLVDLETGCEYIAVSYRDATVTPRLDATGKPKCGLTTVTR